MLDALMYLTWASALAAVVLALACNRSFLNVIRLPRSPVDRPVPTLLIVPCFGLLAAQWSIEATVVGVRPVAIIWPVMLAYFWWCVAWNLRAAAVLLVLLCPSPVQAFNALGHKVIADIAWQELDAETRAEIVRTLRRHPRFDEDFAKQAPADGDQDRWVFQHAATWPDQIRGNRDFDMPTWHYVNFPLFVGGERPVTFNRETEPEGDRNRWNVIQAVAHCRTVIASDSPPADKGVAYCWLFHLIGDLHQPMHSVALVCDRFPNGDRGGNSIPLAQGDNLHALWDNLLGRRHRMSDVAREVADLEQFRDPWTVDTTPDVSAWVAESHELCKSFAYNQAILDAVNCEGSLGRITLAEEYLKVAGAHARNRVVVAGLRLAALLNPKQ